MALELVLQDQPLVRGFPQDAPPQWHAYTTLLASVRSKRELLDPSPDVLRIPKELPGQELYVRIQAYDHSNNVFDNFAVIGPLPSADHPVAFAAHAVNNEKFISYVLHKYRPAVPAVISAEHYKSAFR